MSTISVWLWALAAAFHVQLQLVASVDNFGRAQISMGLKAHVSVDFFLDFQTTGGQTRTGNSGWPSTLAGATNSHVSVLHPELRKFLLKLRISETMHYLLQIGGRLQGIVVKYSEDGKQLQILEDRMGDAVKAVSEAEEKDGKLWMGSVLTPFIAVYSLN